MRYRARVREFVLAAFRCGPMLTILVGPMTNFGNQASLWRVTSLA
jgi:hypothetical protein